MARLFAVLVCLSLATSAVSEEVWHVDFNDYVKTALDGTNDVALHSTGSSPGHVWHVRNPEAFDENQIVNDGGVNVWRAHDGANYQFLDTIFYTHDDYHRDTEIFTFETSVKSVPTNGYGAYLYANFPDGPPSAPMTQIMLHTKLNSNATEQTVSLWYRSGGDSKVKPMGVWGGFGTNYLDLKLEANATDTNGWEGSVRLWVNSVEQSIPTNTYNTRTDDGHMGDVTLLTRSWAAGSEACFKYATVTYVIPEPPTTNDFGDADQAAGYPVTKLAGGARHAIMSGWFLGQAIDGEDDGQPSAHADGDDTGVPEDDDEDGILIWDGASYVPLDAPDGLQVNVTHKLGVVASTSGYLNAWLDLNADGDWDDAGEQIHTDTVVSAGTNELSLHIPIGASDALTFARFRFGSQSGMDYTGFAEDGEVEDYHVDIAAPIRITSISAATSGVVQIEWDDVGLEYTVLTTTNLVNPNWVPAVGVWPATTNRWRETVLPMGTKAAYRVVGQRPQ